MRLVFLTVQDTKESVTLFDGEISHPNLLMSALQLFERDGLVATIKFNDVVKEFGDSES